VVRVTAPISIDPLFDPSVVEDPHAYYAQLRETDPVHRIDGTDAYLVTRLDLIHRVVGEPGVYSSRTSEFLGLLETGEPALRAPAFDTPDHDTLAFLATADPPDHTRQRKVLNRVLSTGAINAREAEFSTLIDAALDRPLETGYVEWMGDIAEPLPMLMVARLLGLPDSDVAALKEQGYAAVEQISGFVPEDRRAVLLDKMLELGAVIEGFAAARATAEPDQSTLIGVCAAAVGNGDLDEMEALGILGLILSAGGESTTSLLGTGVRILAQDAQLQDRLRRKPELIPAFVEEACRVEPPFRGHYRRVLTDTTLGGVDLPVGSRLVLVWPAANRDADTYDQADVLNVDRANPRQHMGFGWGIHLCIGAPLARLEARVTFERLLARTSAFSVSAPPSSLQHHRSLMVRRLVELPLALEPR
jgi:cytochrome P450